jgi:hypothetical protein
MKHLARFFLAFSGVLLLAYYLPAGYWLLAEKNIRAPYIQYSCVDEGFLFYRYENESLKMTDAAGHVFTREEFEQKLPLSSWAQLVKDGRMPKTINGIDIPVEKIRRAQFSARLKPEELDAPGVDLHPLLEAESGRARLEMPVDFMRLSDRIEFLDPKTNKVIPEKTALFAKAFADAGFVFPVTVIGGNPTNRKPYDEGFFLSDARGEIFRLRQVKGKAELLPVIGGLAKGEAAQAWKEIKPRHFVVQESESRELRVLILDQAGRLHLALGPDYRLFTLPLKHYSPSSSVFNLRGDLLNRTVISENEHDVEALAFDRDYKLVKSHEEALIGRDDLATGKLSHYIFPVVFRLEDGSSAFYRLYFDWGNPFAFALNAVLLLAALAWAKWRKIPLKNRWPDLGAIALGGLFGVIVVAALPGTD